MAERRPWYANAIAAGFGAVLGAGTMIAGGAVVGSGHDAHGEPVHVAQASSVLPPGTISLDQRLSAIEQRLSNIEDRLPAKKP